MREAPRLFCLGLSVLWRPAHRSWFAKHWPALRAHAPCLRSASHAFARLPWRPSLGAGLLCNFWPAKGRKFKPFSSVRRAASQFVEQRRPPPYLRSEVDFAFRVVDQSVELFEVRAHWQDRNRKTENPIAKAKFNKTKKNWKVYWNRADLKWHSYKPAPEVATLEEFLALVQEDKHACFFG